jgi:single stranded DNA-binding protein
MIDINECTLLGRLVSEPSIHISTNGACARFVIAVNRRWTGKAGDVKSESAFIPCKAFNGWSTSLTGRMKGTPVLVTGRLRTETWEQDDTSRSQLTLVCESVQVLQVPERDPAKKHESVPGAKSVPF